MKFHRIGNGKNFQVIREGKKVLGGKGIPRNRNLKKFRPRENPHFYTPPTFTAPVISFIQPIQVRALFSSLLGLDLLR